MGQINKNFFQHTLTCLHRLEVVSYVAKYMLFGGKRFFKILLAHVVLAKKDEVIKILKPLSKIQNERTF